MVGNRFEYDQASMGGMGTINTNTLGWFIV